MEAAEAAAGSLSRRGAVDADLQAYVAVHAVVGLVVRSLVERPEAVAPDAIAREARALVRRGLLAD